MEAKAGATSRTRKVKKGCMGEVTPEDTEGGAGVCKTDKTVDCHYEQRKEVTHGHRSLTGPCVIGDKAYGT